MNKITYLGSDREIIRAIAVLKKHKNLESVKESKARLLIQKLIDKHKLKAVVMVNNNPVWSQQRILRNLTKIIRHGTLYNPDQGKPPIISHYFYQFLTSECGSITHNDLSGWVHRYPTIEHFKKFFKCNEFGKCVLDWIPPDRTDARAIVQEIETMLFPFETFLKTRQ